jgi:Holliday junction DNA helicase RuvA
MILTNREISQKLREHANNLASAGGNLYRIRAFRQAAMAVLSLPEEVSSIVACNGQQGLEQFPGIGKSLAETIAGYVESCSKLESVARVI